MLKDGRTFDRYSAPVRSPAGDYYGRIWYFRDITERKQALSDLRQQAHDNGLGIPEEIKNQLFDPFFTTKPVGKGTGMGLAISYQIITERHSGSIECISQPGVGAEFVIRIPLIQERQTSHA